ncbi:MAG: amidase [Hyphomicrobiales bacterium]
MDLQDESLCYMTATELLSQFRSRALSPVELISSLIKRATSLDSKIGSFTAVFFDSALAAAKTAEDQFRRRDPSPRPLEGIPIAIKDLHPIAGENTSYGSRIFISQRDKSTLPTVKRLLDAGAILFARTTTPEFGAAAVTHSSRWGITRNPWNLAFSPGGSSGGAGASVAAGLCTLADGSDYGGSIRIPASCCGLFGYKPPYGRNPRVSPSNLDSYGAYGPITRCVADGALMQNVMSGHHENDIASLRQKVVLPTSIDRPIPLRVALCVNLGYFEVDSEVERNTRAATEVFKTWGCQISEVSLKWSRRTVEAYNIHASTAFAAAYAPYLAEQGHLMSDYGRARIEEGLTHKAIDYLSANQVAGEMYDELAPVLERNDVLICPTTAIPSVPADFSPLTETVYINGRQIPARMWHMTNPFNILSQLPAASIPSGFATDGIPTGIQIIGRSFDDETVFRAALMYESIRPWMSKPSERPQLS